MRLLGCPGLLLACCYVVARVTGAGARVYLCGC